MADKPLEGNPEHGWAQALPLFFDDRVRIISSAVNGHSTRSFIDEGRWDAVRRQLKSGDFVFIQFA